MKIVVINGTEVRGCTYNIKETFLDELRKEMKLKSFICQKIYRSFVAVVKSAFLKVRRNVLMQNM